jgi:hypothetical protein
MPKTPSRNRNAAIASFRLARFFESGLELQFIEWIDPIALPPCSPRMFSVISAFQAFDLSVAKH